MATGHSERRSGLPLILIGGGGHAVAVAEAAALDGLAIAGFLVAFAVGAIRNGVALYQEERLPTR